MVKQNGRIVESRPGKKSPEMGQEAYRINHSLNETAISGGILAARRKRDGP